MEILVSPNSFKGTFSSVEASNIMAKALKDADSEFNIKKLPIADGGDGTMDVFKYYFDYKSVKRKYKNPLGNLVETEYIILDDNNIAIIEFANASGLKLIGKNHVLFFQVEKDPVIPTKSAINMLVLKLMFIPP